jgi:hypothetical protein
VTASWKTISKALAHYHNELGCGVVSLAGEAVLQADGYVNMCQDEEMLTVPGKRISAKQVRTWAWTLRRSRKVQRERAVLWSVYDDATRTSYVGVGALTTKRAAARLEAAHA